MKRAIFAVLACLLCAGLARAEGEKRREYVNLDVRGTLTNRYDIDDYRLGIRIHAWAGSSDYISFNGSPFSGSLWGGGSYISVSGSGVSASVNRYSNGFHVSATVSGFGENGRESRHIYFTMYANGSMDDPDRTPSFWVSGGDANLNVTPSYGMRRYSVSGNVDKERFGAGGTALVGLLASYVLHEREKDKGLPGAAWLEDSPTAAPLRAGVIPSR